MVSCMHSFSIKKVFRNSGKSDPFKAWPYKQPKQLSNIINFPSLFIEVNYKNLKYLVEENTIFDNNNVSPWTQKQSK